MRKIIIFTSVLLSLLINKAFGQIEFDPEFHTSFGYENNIFRSPDILELTDGTVLNENDLVLSDSYLDLGYDLYAKYKINKKHKIRLGHDLWNRIYSQNKALNQFKLNAKFNYDFKINKKMHLGLVYRFDRVNKIGTSVLGSELTQLFSYNKNFAEMHYKYSYMRFSGVQLGASYYKKVFDKAVDIIPLDYTNLKAYITFGQRFHVDKVIFKALLHLEYNEKNFSEKTALNAFGQDLPVNPLRIWKYYSGKISLKGDLPKGFTFKPYVKYKIRDDLFEDYYSYNSLSAGLDLSFENEKIEISLVPEYQNLNYLVKTAPDPNITTDPTLNYIYFNGEFDLRVRIFKGVYLAAEFANKMRDSNTLDLGRRTRRPYKYFEVSGGIVLKPAELF